MTEQKIVKKYAPVKFDISTCLEADEADINTLTNMGFEPFAVTQMLMQPDKKDILKAGGQAMPTFVNKIWFKRAYMEEAVQNES